MKEYLKAIAELTKALTGYFNPTAYEARVLRGLVRTGDKLSDWAKQAIMDIKDPKVKRYVKHYIRKWESDRSKLR